VRPGQKFVRRDLDRVLDAALLVAAPHIAGHGAEAVVPRVGEEAGVEADELAPPLGHCRGEVVVPALLRAAPQEGERLLVAAQEGLEALAEGEGHREEPGVAQHQDEGVDGPADAEDVPELAPVHLGGLGNPEAKRHERLAGGPRPAPPDQRPERADPAAITLGPQDLEHIHGGARRLLDEQRLDAGGKGGEERRPRPGGGPRERHAPAPDDLAHAGPLHAEVPADLAQGPVLGVGEAEDLGLGGGRQHGAPPGDAPRVPRGPRSAYRLSYLGPAGAMGE